MEYANKYPDIIKPIIQLENQYSKGIYSTYLNSNTYIILNDLTDEVWLVDIGDVDKVIAELQPNQTIKGVFFTHSHIDHIYGINELVSMYPNCKIYISIEGRESLFNDKRNFSFYYDTPLNFKGGDIQVIKNRTSINIFNEISMKCIYTPGHDVSCMCYICDKYIFTGDSYIPKVKPVTNLKGVDQHKCDLSLKIIQGYVQNGLVVCPGHGPIFDSL